MKEVFDLLSTEFKQKFTCVTPVDNSITPYAEKVPVFAAYIVEEEPYDFYDDPDAEFLLFEDLSDVVRIMELSGLPAEGINNHNAALVYAIFKVEEGWLLVWDDEEMDWGGNIFYYPNDPIEKKELEEKAIDSYSDCHCSCNIFNSSENLKDLLTERDRMVNPNIDRWVSIFSQLMEG